ncbi:peroxide stress protein YaaA [Porphyromonas gingivalis]|uniref:peroxide stress protein YaaA n=1 Tax=Porphyromonas gingivalis TaxID=837 RepID=UPI0009D675C1|nr:peroxide stress protein YaaA [Porphyromonas gingivalis]
MLILLSCAKTIGIPKRLPSHLTTTSPIFDEQTTKIALAASSCDIKELSRLLRINNASSI